MLTGGDLAKRVSAQYFLGWFSLCLEEWTEEPRVEPARPRAFNGVIYSERCFERYHPAAVPVR